MIFNNEAEIRAYYAGRIEEADRWAYWYNSKKWCGISNIKLLSDVIAELQRDCEQCVERFKKS